LSREKEKKKEFLPGRRNNSCFKVQNIYTFATKKGEKFFLDTEFNPKNMLRNREDN
jgi:hypothetical protein